MNVPIYFDIETIPSQLPGVMDEFRAAVQAPSQYKKPDSIAAWLEENREAEAEAAWLKTSFDGGMGHVCVISWAYGDEAPSSASVREFGDVNQERALLGEFFAALKPGHQFIGHNIIGFDLPFLWKRAMVLGVKPPMYFPRDPKPWGESVCDTMLLWDSSQRAGGSMARICRLMGIPGKGDMDGGKVWPMVRDGQIEAVASYCRDDVARTRAMHRRMTFAE